MSNKSSLLRQSIVVIHVGAQSSNSGNHRTLSNLSLEQWMVLWYYRDCSSRQMHWTQFSVTPHEAALSPNQCNKRTHLLQSHELSMGLWCTQVPSWSCTLANSVQPLNGSSLISLTVDGIVMYSSSHPRKAPASIFCTPSWSCTLAKSVQPLNASSPISLTVNGIVMLSRRELSTVYCQWDCNTFQWSACVKCTSTNSL